MTNAPTTPRTALQTVYQTLLGVAGGFSLGWFGWIFADRFFAVSPELPFWPFAAGGVVIGLLLVSAMGRTARGRKWINVLWIPVVAFVVLMTAIVIALRNWGS